MEFVRKTKMFDQPAVQLNEEEIAKATAAKQRRINFMNTLKKLGLGAAGIAALYGGAKYYQNGGKQFVQNVMDQGANFMGKVGDAAVDAGRNIGTATSNEANRNVTNAAQSIVNRNNYNPFISAIKTVFNQAKVPSGPAVNESANQVVDQVVQPTAQVDGANTPTPAPTPSTQPSQPSVDSVQNAAETNALANEYINNLANQQQAPDMATALGIQTQQVDGALANEQANEDVNGVIQVPDSETQYQETEE